MRQLNVEVTGPHVDRHIAALQKRILAPRQFDPPPPEQKQPVDDPKPAAPEAIRTELNNLKIAPAEVHTDTLDVIHLPLPSAAPTDTFHSGGVPLQRGNGDLDQKPQSSGNHSNEADLITAYVSALARRVNSHLIYPNEVKKKRLEGVTQVAFVVTASGEIQPGSLQIKRSSGSAVLDGNAEKTILSLAPFQKPPHEMAISLEIEFAVDF